MGDMKTPDFDDLLAAFDIPDIDAKEAIQSSPEGNRNDEVDDEDDRRSTSPSSYSEPPVVSVIVKNTLCSESLEEERRNKSSSQSQGGPTSYVHDRIGDQLTQFGPKMPEMTAMGMQVINNIEGSVSSENRSDAEPWTQQLLNSTLRETKSESDEEVEGGSVQHTSAAVANVKTFLCTPPSTVPRLKPALSTSPKLVAPQLSSPNPQKEETVLSNLLFPSPQNGNVKAGSKRVLLSDDEDSEPDLGGPLVIQESPESAVYSPPKFKRRGKGRLPDLLGPPDITSSLIPQSILSSLPTLKAEARHVEKAQPPEVDSHTAAPPLQTPQYGQLSVSSDSSALQKETYPEHVIDERDSPESPPPSETGLIPMRASSPEKDLSTVQSENHKNVQDERLDGATKEQDGNQSSQHSAVEGGENEENSEMGTGEPLSNVAAETGALQPLKVKFKMHSTGITKTSNPPKRKATVKGTIGGSKLPAENNTRVKREFAQEKPLPARAALLESASTAKEHSSARADNKPLAVSITRAAALPPVSAPFPKVSPALMSTGSTALKCLSSGTTTPSPLLQPQSGNKPASIVNSTGAIISRSQTNLVDAFNKILNNKNLLPSYKPDLSSLPPAEWGLPLPVQGYRCLECGDAFALEQSLARHYARRSLRIEVTCNHCAKRLAFFNKCSLLLHAREHKERGMIMQCSHLVMKPVPMEQMISQLEPAPAGQSLPSSGQVVPDSVSQQQKAVTNKKLEGIQQVGNKCPECLAALNGKKELTEHFQEVKLAQTTTCAECSPPMLLSNSCSASAHQRIHRSCKPHICPECGCSVDQLLLQTHLDETCLHFSRRVGYRCSSCLVVFGGLNSVKSHIQQAHCELFHKCPSCPMAFKSTASIQNHITERHPTLADPQTMSIFKCVMCDTVFTNKNLLLVHFDSHLINQKVHVYKCPECTKLFSQRNSLLDHYKSHKAPAPIQELPSYPAASPPRFQSASESSEEEDWKDGGKESVKKERMKTPSGWKCVPCHSRYKDREEYITHMAEQHGKTLKKFPCNKCESSFTTTSSLTRHIRDKHKVTSARGFRCQFCTKSKKMFSSRAMLDKHVQLRHSMEPQIHDTLTAEGRHEADSSSEQDTRVRARRKHRAAVKLEAAKDSSDGPSPAKKSPPASAAQSDPAGFRCAPCGFATEDKAQFLEHISQHQPGGTEGCTLQCLQCGACFASSSSLSRHCFIAHKVRNASAEGQQASGTVLAPSSRNLDGKNPTEGSTAASPSTQEVAEEGDALTCKVCRKHFDKASDLSTHFRTHEGNLASDHDLSSLAVAGVHNASWEPPADHREMTLRLQNVWLILPSAHSHNLKTSVNCSQDHSSMATMWNSGGILPYFNDTQG